MSLKKIAQIFSLLSQKRALHIQNRLLASVKTAKEEEKCKKIEEQKQKKKRKKRGGLWNALFGTDDFVTPEEKKNAEICKKLDEVHKNPIPEFRDLEGKALHTCGTAFVVQKDAMPNPPPSEIDNEDIIIKKMEALPELKKFVDDPMPPFKNVEQRMMDLDKRKLHPLYRKYRSFVRKTPQYTTGKHAVGQKYKTRSGPIPLDDYPEQLKINRELLEKKNMFADYKRVAPPQQLLGKIVEMRMNEKRTLERRSHPILDKNIKKRKSVHETLKQKENMTI